jgi:F420-dependent oxidoreductase-like protein
MELRIFTEPQQGATYDDLLAVARTAEELGFDGFFRSDHYLTMGGDGLPGPTDAWTTLAALARETSSIRLGTLMTSATFRHPGVLAIQVAQVDRMSGGRVELGLGAGWFAQEHTAYGIPFPDTRERFERYAEQLELVTGLWSTPVGETYSFDGEHYRLTDSPALPKPLQDTGHRDGPPVIIGGVGKRRTPELGTPTSSTCRSSTRRPPLPSSAGSGRRARTPGATPTGSSGPTRWCCASGRTRTRSRAGPRRSAGRWTSCASTDWPAPRRRSSTRSGSTPRSVPSGSTSRCWTSPTSTT